MVDNDLIINHLLSLHECRELREAIKTIVESHISIHCFERDLLSSYFADLQERRITAAIYCEDDAGKISK